jgi:hypothetical protein
METGAITLTMTNMGAGPGKGVLAKVTPERTDNLNYNNTYIEEIPPGQSVSAEIPLEAYIGIADGDHTFRFDFEEINGFPAGPGGAGVFYQGLPEPGNVYRGCGDRRRQYERQDRVRRDDQSYRYG